MNNLPPELCLLVFDWALNVSDVFDSIDPLSDLWTDLSSRSSPWNFRFMLYRQTARSISLVCKAWRKLAKSFAFRFVDVSSMSEWHSAEGPIKATNSRPFYLRVNIEDLGPSTSWTEIDDTEFLRPFAEVYRGLQALSFYATGPREDDPDAPTMPAFLAILEHSSKSLRYLEFKNALWPILEDDYLTRAATLHSYILNFTRFERLEVLSLRLPFHDETHDMLRLPINFPLLHSLTLYYKANRTVMEWPRWVARWSLPLLSSLVLDILRLAYITKRCFEVHGAKLAFLRLEDAPEDFEEILSYCPNLQHLVAPSRAFRRENTLLRNLSNLVKISMVDSEHLHLRHIC
jgi:hypothetical protein